LYFDLFLVERGKSVEGTLLSGARCAAVLVSAGCLWVLAGCTAVKATRADGSEEYSIHPFGLGLSAPGWADRRTDGLQHISASSFGVSRSANGFDVGYRKEEVVLAPASCQTVFIINTQEQAETARALTRDLNGQCAVRR
jgi:hypothetical protein